MSKIFGNIFLGTREIEFDIRAPTCRTGKKGFYRFDVYREGDALRISIKLESVSAKFFLYFGYFIAVGFFVGSLIYPSKPWLFYGAVGLILCNQGLMFLMFPKRIDSDDWDRE